MKICPQCKTKYDDTKEFCRYDGSALKAQAARKTLVWTGVGVAAFVVLLGGAWGYRKVQERFISRAPQRGTPVTVPARPLTRPPSVSPSPAPQPTSDGSDRVAKDEPPQEPQRLLDDEDCLALEHHKPLRDAEVLADDVPLFSQGSNPTIVGHLQKGEKIQIAGVCGDNVNVYLPKDKKAAWHTTNVVEAAKESSGQPNFKIAAAK